MNVMEVYYDISQQVIAQTPDGTYYVNSVDDLGQVFWDLIYPERLSEAHLKELLSFIENETEEVRRHLTQRLAYFLPELLQKSFLIAYDERSDILPREVSMNFFYLYWTFVSHTNIDQNFTPEDVELKNKLAYYFQKERFPFLKVSFQDFSGADLRKVHWKNANLENINLQAATLIDADLRGTKLNYANLSQANLSGSLLTNTSLKQTNLDKAQLFQTDARNVNLETAFWGTIELTGANLVGARLSGKDLSHLDLSLTSFSGADLSHCNLSQSDLSLSNLRGANLEGVDLQQAKLHMCDLHKAVLNNSNLRQADLSKANLSWALIKGTDLRGAIVRDANFLYTRTEAIVLDYVKKAGAVTEVAP